ncbi:phospho-sugar mutase [Bacteroidetes bacterium endosymbiont of Geopemphigus sp.]|uniref:phospho-sugar mutase n=1 Tax=Bacteroidetes bacterium endosymbiont of Geopemphigus sp. TaxID=2047937 RepID=UPI000CD1E62B|nr:phospho-sugar mutase [Bacteroidetes bacterium endosymbiont of Geopemphigus sp.]
MNPDILKRARRWLSQSYDSTTRQRVRELIESQPQELVEAFYKDLEFGTGGIRGIMGVGTNRINCYTVGATALGLFRYLKKRFSDKKELRVAIACDVRKNSDFFAQSAASVLSAQGVKVFLFEGFRPTPELSYAVRQLQCFAGIMITASHNPPEYNGYKVYGEDGAQLVSPYDQYILKEIQEISVEDIDFKGNSSLIHSLGTAMDEAFIKTAINNSSFSALGKKDLRIVLSPLHGTAIAIAPEAFRRAGFESFSVVEKQAIPDGNFSTLSSPNPEEPSAFFMAIEQARAQQADLVFTTDPDADRLGVALRDEQGEFVLLSGNQTNTLLIDYLLKQLKIKGRLNQPSFIASTLVSSDIFSALAGKYGVDYEKVFTGFKWISKLIREREGQALFIGGGEESYGFMVGDFVRDKDSITSMLLMADLASAAKAEGSSAYRKLLEIYVHLDCHEEKLITLTRKGASGAKEIAEIMKSWRINPLQSIGGSRVIAVEDYQNSTRKIFPDKQEIALRFPPSNMLIYYTQDDTKIALRPSGTEPKIKFYFCVKSPLSSVEDYPRVKKKLNDKIQDIIDELKL